MSINVSSPDAIPPVIRQEQRNAAASPRLHDSRVYPHSLDPHLSSAAEVHPYPRRNCARDLYVHGIIPSSSCATSWCLDRPYISRNVRRCSSRSDMCWMARWTCETQRTKRLTRGGIVQRKECTSVRIPPTLLISPSPCLVRVATKSKCFIKKGHSTRTPIC